MIEYTGPCPRCGAVADAQWPHPLGQPCPLAFDEHEREQARRDLANDSYVAKLEAERAAAEATRDYYERSQMPVYDMAEFARTMTKRLQEDDE